jgi:hypothetical protein
MHCIQYIATQADSTQEAFDDVKSHLEGFLGDDPFTAGSATWYDWFVTGGGRWSTDDDPYNDNYTGDVVHQTDPKFQEYLDTAHKFRLAQLNQHIEQAREVNLSDLLDKLEDFEHDHYKVGMDLYPVKKLYDMSLGIWDYNSYFFDIVNDTTNRKYLVEGIDNGADNWYLVPVDFHF